MVNCVAHKIHKMNIDAESGRPADTNVVLKVDPMEVDEIEAIYILSYSASPMKINSNPDPSPNGKTGHTQKKRSMASNRVYPLYLHTPSQCIQYRYMYIYIHISLQFR